MIRIVAFFGHVARGNNPGTIVGCDSPWANGSEDYCDPYFKIFINGVEKLVSQTYWDKIPCTGLDVTHVAGSISRTDFIKIEVWDKDSSSDDDLMLRTEGNVDSFLRQSIRRDDGSDVNNNIIVTYSTWKE